ncbi:uncharacterized protein LOC124413276 isoform X3 [Diprion similis]|uniref:uncharacterized protein LOC124413276 isoform X3 n=1 Tax=Diprion similis TaxID=362088 RepID=UPI001EF83090|nr:uncharacterized protein LOC124413276 isoform X3 [Diprion similis]
MWIWDLLQIRKSKGYIEKFYDFVRPSSCNEASSICIVPKITSIFSSVSRPFDSPGYNSFNYDDLVALCTSLIIVCIWVISFKMYIDSLNEMMSGLFSVKPPSPICGRIPSIFFPPSRYRLPSHSDHRPFYIERRDSSKSYFDSNKFD